MRFSALHRSLLLLASCGCGQPTAETMTTASLADGALVVTAATDEGLAFHGAFEMANAPAGEYFAFTSLEPPTSLAALAALDPETCKACDVPGLGQLSGHQTLDEPGSLSLSVFPYEPTSTSYEDTLRYFVLARRGAAQEPLSAIKVHVDVDAAGGCGNPAPPELDLDTLPSP